MLYDPLLGEIADIGEAPGIPERGDVYPCIGGGEFMFVFNDRLEKRERGICGFVGLLAKPGTEVAESFLM